MRTRSRILNRMLLLLAGAGLIAAGFGLIRNPLARG